MVVRVSNGWVETFERLPKQQVFEKGLRSNEEKKVVKQKLVTFLEIVVT